MPPPFRYQNPTVPAAILKIVVATQKVTQQEQANPCQPNKSAEKKSKSHLTYNLIGKMAFNLPAQL